MSKQSDEELMQSFKKGETPVFRELFERYKNPVFAFVRRRVNDAGRAEEITQDIFLALVQRRNGYEVRARFRTYLYKIALNRRSSQTVKGNGLLPPAKSQNGSCQISRGASCRGALASNR